MAVIETEAIFRDTNMVDGQIQAATLPDVEPQYHAQFARLLKHVHADEIPESGDLCSAADAAETWDVAAEPELSLIAIGDIMLGGRAKRVIASHGPAYPFAATLPLFRRAHFVLGNLEGPLCRKSRREDRHYSYKVNPDLADSLADAGVRVVTLANNHLLDCGRDGVLETLTALRHSGVAALGAGVNEAAAHSPVILQAGSLRIGLLGYYWNQRCAATAALPGSAMDQPAALQADIRQLRSQVDRVVVTVHWGIPYVRQPSAEDRAKARWAVDCGADAIIGHHPHIVQPFEIYRDRPIFYSIGNFMMGSGNSRAEGLAVALQFEARRTCVECYPLYVKNRDPRVNYQPKLLRHRAAEQALDTLCSISGTSGEFLEVHGSHGRIELPWTAAR